MMPRVFHPQALSAEEDVRLTDTAGRHVARVLRLRAGDDIVLFDGSGRDFAAHIASIDRQAVVVRTGSGRPTTTESTLQVTLLQALSSGQRMDFVVQKSTELGVAVIQPVLSARCVSKPDTARRARKTDHWRQVAVSACEQSGRSRLPDIRPPLRLADACRGIDPDARALLLDPESSESLEMEAARVDDVILLVGPEGGFTDDERALALQSGFQPIRLGPRTLRTETAPLAAIAILQFLHGDFRRMP